MNTKNGPEHIGKIIPGVMAAMKDARTPATLNIAINNGVVDHANNGGELESVMRNHLRDFLSQKFTTALMKASSFEESAMLKKLFEEIVK